MKKMFAIVVTIIVLTGTFMGLILSGQTDHIKQSVQDAYASMSGLDDVVYKGHTEEGYMITVTRLSDDDYVLHMTTPEEEVREGSDGVSIWGMDYTIHVNKWDSEMESKIHRGQLY